MTILERYSISGGPIVTVRIDPAGAPDMWVGETRLTNDDAIEYAPRSNAAGDIAYARILGGGVTSSFAAADVILNGNVIAAGLRVEDIALSASQLAWIEVDSSNRYWLVARNIGDGATFRHQLAGPADTIAATADGFSVLSLELSTGQRRIETFVEDTAAFSQTALASPAAIVSPFAERPVILEVSGSESARALFLALGEMHDTDAEAFAQGNNETGRIAWYQSQRIDGLAELAQLTGDEDIIARARMAIVEAVEAADENGLYWSTRYSFSGQPINFFVQSAWLLTHAFDGYDLLDEAQAQALVAKAEAAFAYYESDWKGYGYRFTPNVDYLWDGAIMPFNMQTSIGLLALDVYEATGQQWYLDRARDIYDFLKSELVTVSGLTVWDYWPQEFRAGWAAGDIESLHAQTRPRSTTTVYEDTAHAAINVRFLLRAADVFGEPAPIDIAALGAEIQNSSYGFQRFLLGGPVAYQWLPVWEESQQVLELFSQALPSPFSRYDDGQLFSTYAAAAGALDGFGDDGDVSITQRNPADGALLGTITLNGAQAIADYWDYLRAEAGHSATQRYMFGADANDTITATIASNIVYAAAGNDRVYGSLSGDRLDGGNGDDFLYGRGGADFMYGGAGADYIDLGEGDDAADGGAGDDLMKGMAGNDTMTGAGGNDSIYGNDGNDVLGGGAGEDYIDGGNGDDAAEGGAGADLLKGMAGDDRLSGNQDNDKLYGHDGNDTLSGGGGDDLLDGGAGIDTASYASAAAAVTVRLAYVRSQDTQGDGVDFLKNIENLVGSGFNDRLYGDSGANSIAGGAGNDSLYGMEENDILSGDAGEDFLDGGQGADRLDGGADNDLLKGMAGDDWLSGGAGVDALYGADGNDILSGGEGDDYIDGGVDIDTVSYAQAAAGVAVNLALRTRQNTGGAGADIIKNVENIDGSAWNDILRGDSLDNRIDGGGGNDTLYGGGGNDVFVFDMPGLAITAHSTIGDFSSLAGNADTLRLAGNAAAYAMAADGAGNTVVTHLATGSTITFTAAALANVQAQTQFF